MIALGVLPSNTSTYSSVSNNKVINWIFSDIGFLYFHLTESCTHEFLNQSFLSQHKSILQQICYLLDDDSLTTSSTNTTNVRKNNKTKQQATNSNSNVSTSVPANSRYSNFSLSIRQIIRLNRSLQKFNLNKNISNICQHPEWTVIRHILERMLLIRYMPKQIAEEFYRKTSIQTNNNNNTSTSNTIHVDKTHDNPFTTVELKQASSSDYITYTDTHLTIADLTLPRRSHNKLIEKIPNPLFYDNAAHKLMLRELIEAFINHEKAFLIIGNQGVGKNKIVDRLLFLMNAEREYMQLHRESTIQSLTLLPTIENGKIIYLDSPLLRAAKTGRILVLDEADKAPVEVITALKALVEDQEIQLYDGRILITKEKYLLDGGELHHINDDYTINTSNNDGNRIILIHPEFRMFVLANRPGFPFLGRQLGCCCLILRYYSNYQ